MFVVHQFNAYRKLKPCNLESQHPKPTLAVHFQVWRNMQEISLFTAYASFGFSRTVRFWMVLDGFNKVIVVDVWMLFG